MSIRIICDSASDIAAEKARDWKVTVLPIKTIFGDQEYLDGVTMSHKEFYEKLIETDELPKTSQISPFDYEEAFKEVVEAGDTAICITLSSKLSGCYQSAHIAAQEFKDQIMIVDSENVCIGEQLLVELAVQLREEGKTAGEIVSILNQEKKNIRLIALLDTLEYLKKGGRISATAAFAGTLLSIKPVITITEGEIAMLGKARGSKNGSNMLIRLVEEEGGINLNKPINVAYSGLSDDCLQKYLQDSKKLYEGKEGSLPICTIGSTIGTHVGPGAIAAAFFVNQ
ncbi:MAG: DegV family protein [bacterium]|nr:DegV family protein [bacterium]